MYTPDILKKTQLRLLHMAKTIRNILENHNIPYFITYGTLLGAVRHEGFIPWDDDFDFYLFEDSYDKAMQVLEEYLPSDLFLENEKTEKLYFHGWSHVKDCNSVTECELFPQDSAYTHRGISIDLYKAYIKPASSAKQFLFDHHLAYLKRRYSKGLLDKEDFENRIETLKSDFNKEMQRHSSESDTNDYLYLFPSPYKEYMAVDEMFPLKKYKFEDTEFLGPKDAHIFLKRCYRNYMELPPVEKRHPHYSNVIFLD